MPRRPATLAPTPNYEYSYTDREGRRVRWTQPKTADAPAQSWAMTFKTPREAAELQAYLEYYQGEVSRWDPVIEHGLYRNGKLPEPGATHSPDESFAAYAQRQNDANDEITESSRRVADYRLRRACVPLADGRSLADIPVKAVNKDLLDDLTKALRLYRHGKRGQYAYATTTIRLTLAYVLGIVRRAQRDGLIAGKAVDGYKLPAAERKQLERALEWEDWLAIRSQAKSEQQLLLFDFLAESGCRLGEALYLASNSIQLPRNGSAKVYIKGTYLSDGSPQDYTKTRQNRVTYITRRLAEDLRAFAHANKRMDGLLFRSVRDERSPLRHQTAEHQFTSMVKRAVEAGEVVEWPYHHSYPTPHNLRHSYITWALSDGKISPVEVASRSGHTMNEMWKTYAASLSGDKSRMDDWQEQRSPRRSAFAAVSVESDAYPALVDDAVPGRPAA